MIYLKTEIKERIQGLFVFERQALIRNQIRRLISPYSMGPPSVGPPPLGLPMDAAMSVQER
jgi:hypothetical protein